MTEAEDIDMFGNLSMVRRQLEAAVLRRKEIYPKITPRLVCVSKTKPASLIIQAYDAGQRYFGENYANELNEKASDAQILEKCKDIKWHFIGHLQTNKLNKVISCPGLSMIETIHSQKLANLLNKQWPAYAKNEEKLKVMIQVNTSGEDVKNGVEPSDVSELAIHIREKCPNLLLKGLMTIGQYGFDCSQGINPDFVSLGKCRETVCAELNLDIADLELSMGMSSDFEHAIELGSTNIRVGSTIFGARPKKEGV